MVSAYKSVLHCDSNLQKAQSLANKTHAIPQLNLVLHVWFPWCDAADVSTGFSAKQAGCLEATENVLCWEE